MFEIIVDTIREIIVVFMFEIIVEASFERMFKIM